MIMFDYYFYFLPWLWSALELFDRALYKLSFIYYLFIYRNNSLFLTILTTLKINTELATTVL